MGKFDEIYQRSMSDPESFWGEAAEAIDWYKRWDKVLEADGNEREVDLSDLEMDLSK